MIVIEWMRVSKFVEANWERGVEFINGLLIERVLEGIRHSNEIYNIKAIILLKKDANKKNSLIICLITNLLKI